MNGVGLWGFGARRASRLGHGAEGGSIRILGSTIVAAQGRPHGRLDPMISGPQLEKLPHRAAELDRGGSSFWGLMLIRTKYLACAAVVLLSSGAAFAESDLSGLPALKTASRHPVQYYLSLPKGWSAQKQWPVLLAI